jgi:hypothetical protein
MSPRLESVRLKVERANHHLRDLEGRLHAFRETRPYSLYSEPDSDVGHQCYKVRVHNKLPPEFTVIVGEVVHQLRSSLDHLARQLWDSDGRRGAEDSVYFPIYETEAKYVASRKAKVEGFFAPAVVSVLDTLQPHAAGNDLLWKLHKLNNIDKHRHLTVVDCVVDSLGMVFGQNPNPFPLTLPKPLWPDGSLKVVEDGAIVAAVGTFKHPSGRPAPEMDAKLQVTFEIVFDEPRIVRGEPVVHLLHQLAGLTDNIVVLFDRLL